MTSTITNPDLLIQHAKDVLAKWDSPEFDKPDSGTMAVHIGQLRANVRMMAEFIEAHAGTCPIRTGSALDRPRPISLDGCTCGGIGDTGSHRPGCQWSAL